MYADEYEERMPPNNFTAGPSVPFWPDDHTWVKGWLVPGNWDDWSDNTNMVYLRESLLGPYLGRSTGVWRCPADPSMSRHQGELLPRVRSYSMNIYMNLPFEAETSRWKTFRKTSEITKPPPSETFVLIDEREDSIEDALFQMDLENLPVGFAAIPRASHNREGTLSFADGHVQKHKWRDPRTQPPLRPNSYVEIIRPSWEPNNPDAVWLNGQATGLKR
jgi:prepilin-type processing-associated H-X9-DG protein